ncbi:MAG: hypothetical protein K9N11_03160 [Lentisphaeria bacterium]|nr:hypothetical protein [Candidatus Neomarinimicrobiota bacterium]MCF7841832.1 hypothetical protein [Lentisphaeria bacterium]
MCKKLPTILFTLLLSVTVFSQSNQNITQIIHLETDQYFTRSATRIAIWNKPGEWDQPGIKPVAELRVKPEDIIVQRGLSIYRYQPDRQVITTYDKRINALETIPLSALKIYGVIAAWNVSEWGDFWFITSDGDGIIVPTNGTSNIPFRLPEVGRPDNIVAIPGSMVVISEVQITIYDLFGNRLFTFSKPSISADYAGFTRQTMIFKQVSPSRLIAIDLRPGSPREFQLPDSSAIVISDDKSNTVRIWSPAAGHSVLTPIQDTK